MREPDDGMTVIELLIAMVIMLIITVPLVTSFVIGTKTALGSAQDANDSADAQLLGYYFDTDVSSAATVTTAAPSWACGNSDTFLELTWTDGVQQVVAYEAALDTARMTELATTTQLYRLDRVQCSGGVAGDPTRIARSMLAPPTLTCDGVTPCASTTPRRVTMQVTERSIQQSDTTGAPPPDSFSFGVTAVRKVVP